MIAETTCWQAEMETFLKTPKGAMHLMNRMEERAGACTMELDLIDEQNGTLDWHDSQAY